MACPLIVAGVLGFLAILFLFCWLILSDDYE